MMGANGVEQLHPIRVLIVARDRRFLRSANVLLSRHGCDVTQLERPSELLDEVRRQRPNVVVLDGSDSLSATAKRVAALDGMPMPVAAVVVHETADGNHPLRSLRILPKWGSFDELVTEVHRLYHCRWAGAGVARQSVL